MTVIYRWRNLMKFQFGFIFLQYPLWSQFQIISHWLGPIKFHYYIYWRLQIWLILWNTWLLTVIYILIILGWFNFDNIWISRRKLFLFYTSVRRYLSYDFIATCLLIKNITSLTSRLICPKQLGQPHNSLSQ